MLPAVILVIYALIMLLIFLVLIPILGMVFIDNLQHFLDKIAQKNHQAPVDGTLVLSILWVFFAIITGSFWVILPIFSRFNLLCYAFQFTTTTNRTFQAHSV